MDDDSHTYYSGSFSNGNTYFHLIPAFSLREKEKLFDVLDRVLTWNSIPLQGSSMWRRFTAR